MKRLFALLFCIVFSLSLFSCKEENDPTPKSRVFYEYFDTYGTFADYSGSDSEDFEALADRVEAILSEYNKLFDIYNEYDGTVNLKTVNDRAGEGAIEVDGRIIDMLLFAKDMHEQTNGCVNVAMGSVLKIWHEHRSYGIEFPNEATLPDREKLLAAAEHTDIDSLLINEELGTVELVDGEMSLDVGAVGKGYAVEMIARMLEEEGYSGYTIDLGGNLRVVGEKPSGKGWTAGIKDPQNPYSTTYIYKSTLKDCALVTSGTYERFYTVEGVRYHHIINGETLMPENYYLSVSIKTASSAVADALSTAIFNMPYDTARQFCASLSDTVVVLVLPSGEVRTFGE